MTIGQPPTYIWEHAISTPVDHFIEKAHNEYADVAPSPDGGAYIVGQIWTPPGPPKKTDSVIIRVSPSGEEQWKIISGLPNQYDRAHRIHIANNGDLLVSGLTSISDDGIPWLKRMDQKGNIIWDKQYKYSPNHSAGHFSIASLGNGDLVFSGPLHHKKDGGIERQGWILILGGDGNQKSSFLLPLTLYSDFRGIIADGKYIYVLLSEKGYGRLTKLDTSGNTIWNVDLGEIRWGSEGRPVALFSGGILVVGSWLVDNGKMVPNATFFSAEGKKIWGKQYQVKEFFSFGALGVSVSQSQISISGWAEIAQRSAHHALLMGADNQGELQWAQTSTYANYGCDFNAVAYTADNGLIAVGVKGYCDNTNGPPCDPSLPSAAWARKFVFKK